MKSNDPNLILSMLRELSIRNGLIIALSGRTPDELLEIVNYISSNIRKARYQSELIEVAHTLIDLYSPAFGLNKPFDDTCKRLLILVENECALTEFLMEIKGEIESAMSLNGIIC